MGRSANTHLTCFDFPNSGANAERLKLCSVEFTHCSASVYLRGMAVLAGYPHAGQRLLFQIKAQ